MRFKFTVILLALNSAAFGLILYLGKQNDPNEKSAAGLSGQIGRQLIDADRIELHGRDIEIPRVLERNGSTWTLTAPMQWSANYFAINRILNQLQFLEEEASFNVDEVAKTGQTLADYGLEDPLLKLTIAEGDERTSLSIGTLTEIGNNVYLLGPNEKEIYVVDRQVIDGLLIELNDLRTREIFDIPVFEVDALGLEIRSDSTADGSFLKVRLAKSNGSWSFEAPLAAEADPALVANTMNTLTGIRVGRFISASEEANNAYGLEAPYMRVTLHGNKRRQTLVVGGTDPDSDAAPHYFAKLEDNPAVFTVPAEPFERLKEAQQALRERNFMDFKQSQVSALNVSENGRTIRLQKLETGGWQVLESKGTAEIQPYRADAAIIEELLEDLENLRASGFEADAPTATDLEDLGFNKPRRIITLSFEDKDPLVLKLAHPDEENNALFANTNRDSFIYQVERRPTLRLFPLNALHYRTRTLEALPAAARIQSLSLINLKTNTKLLDLELSQESWEAYLQGENEDLSLPIRTLLAGMRRFYVEEYLSDTYNAEAYVLDATRALPWAYQLSATVELPGGETERTEQFDYQFTERLSGTVQIGGSKRHNVMFESEQGLVDALYTFIEDMPMPPEAIDADLPIEAPIEPVVEPQPIPAPQN